ncbi:uncharacterized protein F5891DRAFT_1212748 [Suillus fuscotomentosus]|uniref:Uncharacterized protein n=1 Tax=Suillus fuscotomentosus TaxID=1912939 RepID=A0AAD4DR20_9AGAM|nr:uncharacterized protein F5891DRAFT_1212748 [Suillus fuscotomentosus]KAG1890592.1 hypothetical protein F5891DRAFT_1212748 [Suillus fuscotomentosus]
MSVLACGANRAGEAVELYIILKVAADFDNLLDIVVTNPRTVGSATKDGSVTNARARTMHKQGAPARAPATEFDPLANHPAASKVMAQQQPSRKPSSTFQPREREIIGTTYTWSSPNSEFNQRKASLVTRLQIQARVLWATISAPFNSLLTLHRPLFTVAVPLPALHEAMLIHSVRPTQKHNLNMPSVPATPLHSEPNLLASMALAPHILIHMCQCPDRMLAGAKCFVSSRIQAAMDIDLCNLAKLEAVMSVVEMAGSAPEGCEMWVREGPAVKRGWRRQKMWIDIRIVGIAIRTDVDRHPLLVKFASTQLGLPSAQLWI